MSHARRTPWRRELRPGLGQGELDRLGWGLVVDQQGDGVVELPDGALGTEVTSLGGRLEQDESITSTLVRRLENGLPIIGVLREIRR